MGEERGRDRDRESETERDSERDREREWLLEKEVWMHNVQILTKDLSSSPS